MANFAVVLFVACLRIGLSAGQGNFGGENRQVLVDALDGLANHLARFLGAKDLPRVALDELADGLACHVLLAVPKEQAKVGRCRENVALAIERDQGLHIVHRDDDAPKALQLCHLPARSDFQDGSLHQQGNWNGVLLGLMTSQQGSRVSNHALGCAVRR